MRKINTIKRLLKVFPEFRKPRPFIDFINLYYAGIITKELYQKIYRLYYKYFKIEETKKQKKKIKKGIKKTKKSTKKIKKTTKKQKVSKDKLLKQLKELKKKLKELKEKQKREKLVKKKKTKTIKKKATKKIPKRKRKIREVPAVKICSSPIPKDVVVPKSWNKWKPLKKVLQILEKEFSKETGLKTKILFHYSTRKLVDKLYMNFSDKFRNLISMCPDKVLYFHKKHIKDYNIYFILEVKDEYEIEKNFNIDKDEYDKFYLLGKFSFRTLRWKRLKRIKGGKEYYKKVDRWQDMYDLYNYMAVSGMTARLTYEYGGLSFHQGGTMNEAIRQSFRTKMFGDEKISPNDKYEFKMILGFEPVSYYIK
jgi:hypothetical protein